MAIKTRPLPTTELLTTATPDSIERPRRAWLRRALHTSWRKAVRIPWKNVRRRFRSAMAARSDGGVPVAVDRSTELSLVPFDNRFPPPLAQCVVVPKREYDVKFHPLSVNSAHSEGRHYLGHSVAAPAMTLEHLVDHYWHPALGLLIARDGRVWRHSFLVPFQDGYLRSVKAIVDRTSPEGATSYFFHEERLGKVERISDPRLLIATSDGPNYGHYILDIIPLAHVGAQMSAPMLTWTLKPWQRAALARLDVPAELIREIPPRTVFLEHPIVSNRLTGVGSLFGHPHHKEAFGRILINVRKETAGLRTPERVLICRSLSHSRNLKNRAEMIAALSALGFTAIQPEKLSFDEQALTFANAEVIVGEFGAALANMMFCRPGATLIELIAEGQDDPWSAHLAAMLELNHVVLFQRLTEEDLRRNESRRVRDARFEYSVDLPRLVETVKSLIPR